MAIAPLLDELVSAIPAWDCTVNKTRMQVTGSLPDGTTACAECDAQVFLSYDAPTRVYTLADTNALYVDLAREVARDLGVPPC